MAQNDIIVAKEDAAGVLSEVALSASDLKLGTTSGLPVKTGTGGVLEAGAFGSAAGQFCEGNDARLSDVRTPSAHTHTSADITDLNTSGIAAGLYDQTNAQTGVTVNDYTLRVQGPSGYVDLDAGSTSGTRGINFPDASGTLALTSDITKAAVGLGNVSNTAQVTSVTGTAPIVSSGGTTPAISVTVGTTANTVAAGDDSRITGAAQKASNLSDLASASTARTNLGLGTAATAASGDFAAASHNHDASAITSGTLATARLGSGTANSGTYLRGDQTWAAVTAGIGGSTGSTDNAILRADGTGGSTSQSSAIVINDEVRSFTGVTGNASTDIITVTGSGFSNGQQVRFTALTGGGGLNTSTNYFVINASGDTFQISTTQGGSFVNFTTNITDGTLLNGHSTFTNVTLSNISSESNSSIAITPKGTGSLVANQSSNSNPRGVNAVDWQMDIASASQVASGNQSVISGGRRNAATNTAATVCGGAQNTASGNSSTVIGGGTNTASAIYSLSAGTNAVADRHTMFAVSGGRFSADGDAQRAAFVLRCKTTTNAAVEMALDGGTTYLTIPSGKVIFCNIKIVGVKSDGSAVATYERQYAAKNVAGTSSEVFAAVTIGTDNAASTTLAIATVDAGDYISIKPTGIASETWRWVASVDAVEVAYGS